MAVVNITFRSEQLKRNTQVCLCLPDAIRMNDRAISDRKVLWLLHGLSEDNTSWLTYSNIAYYAMKGDFIVIMPAGDRSMYCDNINGQNYFKFVADELPEYFHQIFGISNEREKNYIAGLSMGGLGAAKIALTYPERYKAMGSFSGLLDLSPLKYVLNDEMKNDFPFMLSALDDIKHTPLSPVALLDKDMHKDLKMYISSGLQDNLVITSMSFKRRADKLKLDCELVLKKGRHEWTFWDPQVKHFCEKIMGCSCE